MRAKAAVICLCYNHEEFVIEAIKSVFVQTYPTELIVVDDASVDRSAAKIRDFVKDNPTESIKTLFFSDNMGNCKAFNEALLLTDADYVIDLAADDILLPQRVERGISALEKNLKAAINFSNANYIDQWGKYVGTHYEIDSKGHATEKVPQGYLFSEILASYFICSPSMMFRSSYLKAIGGYDPNLAYEDFDILLRLSRNYPLCYTDHILVEKRLLDNSMSTNQYKRSNKQLDSTLRICEKAYGFSKTKNEKKALLKRVAYECKQAFINKRFSLFLAFINLGVKTILKK